jgi:hypothetical protein
LILRKEGNMKTALTLLILCTVLVVSAFSQPNPDTLWTRIYQEGQRSWAFDIQLTADGGYIVAGYAQMPPELRCDGYLLKIDYMGNVLWSQTYGGIEDDQFYSVQPAADGGYVAAGCTKSFGFPDNYYNFYLVKTDAGGNMMWTRAYGGSSTDQANCIRQTDDGGYVFTGYSVYSGVSDENCVLFKVDENGDSLWIRRYGGTGFEMANHVEQTLDGGYILAGDISFGIGDGGGAWLIKTDASGDTMWTKLPTGSLGDEFQSVQQTSDGGYICCGSTWAYGQSWDADGYIVKTDDAGDTLWTTVFNLTQWDYLLSVCQTSSGGFIAAGWVDFEPPCGAELLLLKADAGGNYLWHRTYEGSQIVSYGTSVRQTTDGGYVVAGYTGGSLEEGIPFCYVVRTGIDEPSIVQPHHWRDVPSTFLLHPPYPNPFNAAISISYDIPILGLAKVAVYNILGQQVAVLVDDAIAPGSYSMVWDAGDLPSGIYFVYLSAAKWRFTRKILLLK